MGTMTKQERIDHIAATVAFVNKHPLRGTPEMLGELDQEQRKSLLMLIEIILDEMVSKKDLVTHGNPR